MGLWIDEYPHKVWTNILTFGGQYLDYKIGGSKRDWQTWTMRWNEEIRNNKDAIAVVSYYKIVNNSEEHEIAFDEGNQLVEDYIKKHGRYQF